MSNGTNETTVDSERTGFFGSVINFFTTLLSYFNPFSENFILLQLWEFFTSLLDLLNPFSENFFLYQLWDFLTDIFSGIGTILSYLNPLSPNFFGYKIIDLLKTALQALFVPSEERINAITNTVSSKFTFVDTIKTAIQSLQNIINNLGNAPKLEITIGSTQYTSQQTVKVLDFSWYAPFKSYGDLIITGFVYAFFLWRLFINLPNIIHGLGGVVDSNQMLGDIEAYRETGFGRASSFNFRRGGGRR